MFLTDLLAGSLRRRMSALAFLIGALCAGAGHADWIYPKDGINANIARLEAAVASLIDRAGDTVDRSTLIALQRALAAMQSTKLAFGDELDTALDAVEAERSAILYGVQDQLIEIDRMLSDQTNTLAASEERLSNTLQRAFRANLAPWVETYGPPLYLPQSSLPLRIVATGQNLSDPRNRLIVDGVEFSPRENLPNRIAFTIDRSTLTLDDSGFASMALRAHRIDETCWFWIWCDDFAPIEYRLQIKAAGDIIGHVVVETEIPTPERYETRTQSFFARSPDNEVFCVNKGQNESFDTGYTTLRLMQNQISWPAVSEIVPMGHIDFRCNVAARVVVGPRDPSALQLNTPESICVRLHSPARAGRAACETPVRPMVIPTTTVRVEIDHRVRIEPEAQPFLEQRDIAWTGDTDIRLPEGFQGVRARFTYAGEAGRSRLFTGPARTDDMEIDLDVPSRTLIFRPVPVE